MRREDNLVRVSNLEREIVCVDEEIDKQVYVLYGLTKEEIKSLKDKNRRYFGEGIMSETEVIDFSKYEWQEKWPSRLGYYLYVMNKFIAERVAGFENTWPPMGFFPATYVKLAQTLNTSSLAGTSKLVKLYRTIYLREVAKSIGIDDEESQTRLQHHWKRIQRYNSITYPVSLLIGILAVIVVMFIAIGGLFLIFGDVSNLAFGALILIMLWMWYAFTQISRRIVAGVMQKYYADTLTTVSALYLVVELLRQNVLEQVRWRRQLQNRLHQLSQNILMLAAQYKSNSPEDQLWIHSHFNSMARYVREHERLIVAPKTDSLDVMRGDFLKLLKILISGQYGEFNHEYAQPSILPEQSMASKVTRIVLGFIGITMPTLFLYFILFTDQHERINKIGLDEKTVTLIVLAWFLLTIDAALKLGIVERIIGLAKSIRDLG